MNITGLITEYNPLHQGHLYHIEQTRNLLHPDILIIIVTSWFSSRGLPSLLSRNDKAKLCLQAGADLVLELPCIYAAQSADRFAMYAIESLKTAGVNNICFGSETGDLKKLETLAGSLDLLIKDPSTSLVRNTEKTLNQPLRSNDILGVQYIRYCRMFGITPYCIKRNEDFVSATQTRKDFFEGKKAFLSDHFMSQQCWSSYYPALRTALMMSPSSTLRSFLLVEEGIESRLRKAAEKNFSWEGFLEDCVSKTYSRARIQRSCLFILLQITKEDFRSHDHFFFLRILGMNDKGRRLLSSLPKGTPMASRIRDLPEFLRMVEHKSRLLYESVLDQRIENEDRMVIQFEKED